jgi:hypothetical protein
MSTEQPEVRPHADTVEVIMQTRSTTDLALVLLGLLAWVAAIVFAIAFPTVELTGPSNRAPNVAAAGAAGGFAVAGGLCLLGAAFASRESGRIPGQNGSGPPPGAAP